VALATSPAAASPWRLAQEAATCEKGGSAYPHGAANERPRDRAEARCRLRL